MQKISSIPFAFRFLIGLALLSAIGAAYYYMYFVPLQAEQVRLETEYDDIVYRINDLKPYTVSYEDFVKQLSMMQEQLSIVVEALPEESGYYMLYDEAVGLAEKDGVKVTLFQPAGERPIDDFHSSVESSYDNFVRYLYDINYLTKMINLQKMEIRVLENQNANKMLSVTATLNSYKFNSISTTGEQVSVTRGGMQ
jgi:type IV pilus assembly protein PilO